MAGDDDTPDIASDDETAHTTSDDDTPDTASDGDTPDTASDRPSNRGTYVLFVDLAEPSTIGFGAAGVFDLDAGRYAYVGSAFGPGGLSRVTRHRELADGSRNTRHWHVDYLLGHHMTTIETVLTAEGANSECSVATALGEVGELLSLGASDCACAGHLAHEPGAQSLGDAAESVLDA